MPDDKMPESAGQHVHVRKRPSSRLLPALRLLICLVLPLSVSAKASAQIMDAAQMFSSSTVVRANQIIARMHAKTGKTIWVETFTGIPVDISKAFPHASLHRLFYQWAGKIGQTDHVNGVVIIICRKPGYLIIRGGKGVLKSVLSRRDVDRASRVMLALFRSDQFQSGLLTGIQFISSTVEQHTAAAPRRMHGRSGRSHRVLILVIVLMAIFVAFWLLTRRPRPMDGPPMNGPGIDPQTSGLMPNTTPVVAGPPAGGSSAMGTFVSGMTGGVVGAVAGNMLYNAVEGQSPEVSPPDQPVGSDTGGDLSSASTPDPASDWTGGGRDDAAGGAFDDSTDANSTDGDASDDSSDDGDGDDGGAF
ncbi:MAG: TPM domain-containing protein [Phycisphaerae bacterium]